MTDSAIVSITAARLDAGRLYYVYRVSAQVRFGCTSVNAGSVPLRWIVQFTLARVFGRLIRAIMPRYLSSERRFYQRARRFDNYSGASSRSRTCLISPPDGKLIFRVRYFICFLMPVISIKFAWSIPQIRDRVKRVSPSEKRCVEKFLNADRGCASRATLCDIVVLNQRISDDEETFLLPRSRRVSRAGDLTGKPGTRASRWVNRGPPRARSVGARSPLTCRHRESTSRPPSRLTPDRPPAGPVSSACMYTILTESAGLAVHPRWRWRTHGATVTRPDNTRASVPLTVGRSPRNRFDRRTSRNREGGQPVKIQNGRCDHRSLRSWE